MRYGCIYKIENKVNGKVYIGRTIRNVKTRFREHCRPKTNKWNRSLINDAIQLHGEGAFIFEVLETNVPENKIDSREEYYIEVYDCMAPKGYNCIKRQEVIEVSQITRNKMSAAKKGKVPWNKDKRGKQKAWNKGRYNYSGCKPIYSVCMKTGEVKYYKSSADAVREGFNSGHITQCRKGRLKHHKGYYWHYNKEKNSE